MADAKKCKVCGEWLNDEVISKQNTQFENDRGEPEALTKEDVASAPQPVVAAPASESAPKGSKESLFKSCFWEQMTKHYCDFKGNVDRKTFWICYLYSVLHMWVIGGISLCLPLVGNILMWIVSLGLTLPFLGLMVRRLHDIGKKGIWILVALVPLVGPIWLLALMAKKGETKNPNKWNVKDTIITITMLLVSVGLFAVGLFATGSESEAEGKSSFKGIKRSETAEIRQQVLDAFNNGTIYDLITPDFEEKALTSAYLLREFHVTNSYADCLDLLFEQDKISVKEVTLVTEDKAEVRAFALDESPILVMVRDEQTMNQDNSRWLIDDVCSFFGIASMKNEIMNCANGIDWGKALADWEEEMAEYDKEDEKWSPKNETEAEIQRQIVNAYKSGSIDDIMTPEFQAAEKAMNEALDKGFHPPFFTDEPASYSLGIWGGEDTEVRKVEMRDSHKAIVYVTLLDWYDDDICARMDKVLIVVYDHNSSKWLIDDEGEGSKEEMIEFATKSNNTWVVIDGSELRLRLGPSTSSETLKWGDGSNRHPDVGEKFKCLGESVDFYKIDYKGNEVWVSKQYTHTEMQ